MTTDPGQPWFYPKRRGYGAVPATWEGWAATAVFVVGFILTIVLIHSWERWLYGGVLIVILAGVACAKTEGGWRWRRR